MVAPATLRTSLTCDKNEGNAGVSIKVIGTGFGRTGTDSMREALARPEITLSIIWLGGRPAAHSVAGPRKSTRASSTTGTGI
jgi:hypothetical protein